MLAHNVDSLDDIHPVVVAAVAEHAEQNATMVIRLLVGLDQRLRDDGYSTGVSGLPSGFLLELGAILQLKLWELEGLRDYLPPGLPTYEQASADLRRRANEAPKQFDGYEGARLCTCVLEVWLERIAWAGPNLLQADVVLGEADEDALIDSLAQLLWDHRHDVPSLGSANRI